MASDEIRLPVARLAPARRRCYRTPTTRCSPTVAEDVSFGPLNLGLDEAETRRRVDSALASLHISHLADRATHMLSFGQKKRVAIAGLVAMQPEILMLDEPTAGLDPRVAYGVQDVTSAAAGRRSPP
jgi:cobalt/nickel transport system ATP-binding protein